MGKNSFVFHGDWLDFIEKFPAETQFEIYRAIAHYGLHREMPELSQTAKVLLTVISTKLDEDNERYNRKCDQNRENAKGDGSKSRRSKANKEQLEADATTATVATDATVATTVGDCLNSQHDNDSDNDNDLKKEKEKKCGRFIPPTVETVADYIKEKKYHVSASAWWDFYASKGWMVGKNKMVSWKNAVATWEHKWLREHEERDKTNATGFEKQLEAGATALERVSARVNARLSQKTAIDTNDLFSQSSDSSVQR